MKTLYIECNMGVAGDMLMGALLDTIENKQEFIEQMNKLQIPNTEISYYTDEKCGITGTHITVKVLGEEEGCHTHQHTAGEHHHKNTKHHEHCCEGEKHHKHCHDEKNIFNESNGEHHHSTIKSIFTIIDTMSVSEKVKCDIKEIYMLIAKAESKAHGKSVEQIHFHEVGTMDALADITGCCLLMEQIGAEKIVVSPITTGFGTVECAHGILPVPAPATAHILKGIPTNAGMIESELCTPTGAALVKYFAHQFSHQPEMVVETIGYGMGNKDFSSANCVRVFLGEGDEKIQDTIVELACNIDDMTGEEIGYAKEKLLEGKAVDVYLTAISMKKSRPGMKLSVLCKVEDREEVVREIFELTTTIGIREYVCPRYILKRTEEKRQTPLGEVRVKVSEGYGVKKEKIEYEDLKNILED